jgi:hypothetical protein
MAGIVRANRFEKLKAEADKAKADLVEVRGALLRILQTSSERDQARHEQELAEDALRASRDHIRVLIADRIIKHGPFEISDAGQDEAYRHADQVQIAPDPESKVTRFSLLEGVALRELPARPVAVPPPADTPGTLDASGTVEGTGPGPSPDEAPVPAESTEPLPS